jgi:hypothetical protein
MKETSFHVTDFAGLYPVWPIIEFSMAPMGTAKDTRMSSFTKCITALLGEILYVDEKAMIVHPPVLPTMTKQVISQTKQTCPPILPS